MEIYAYLGLAILAIFFSLKKDVISSSRIFFAFWITAYTTLILVVRNTFDFDIRHYADSMSYKAISIYYLKEPVVWFGHRLLFTWLQNPFYVFLISDLIVGLILFRALRNFKLPQYAFFSFLIFFPFVLGMQNVYRQWVANIFLLYSFSLVWSQRSGIRRYTFFTLSVLSHNAAAIFIPLLFIRNEKLLRKLMWYGSFLVATVGLILGAETKSSANTGSDFTLLYLSLIIFLLILVPLLDKGIIRKARMLEYNTLIAIAFLSSSSIFLLASAGAERVSMFGLMLAYPILVLLIDDRFKHKVVMRAVFSLLGFLPMLLFGISIFIFGCDDIQDAGTCVRAP